MEQITREEILTKPEGTVYAVFDTQTNVIGPLMAKDNCEDETWDAYELGPYLGDGQLWLDSAPSPDSKAFANTVRYIVLSHHNVEDIRSRLADCLMVTKDNEENYNEDS